jgi:hypothetical protein
MFCITNAHYESPLSPASLGLRLRAMPLRCVFFATGSSANAERENTDPSARLESSIKRFGRRENKGILLAWSKQQ